MRAKGQLVGVLVTVAVLVGVVVLGGCPPKATEPPVTGPPGPSGLGAPPSTPAPTAPPPQGEAIKIGAIFSVTGGMAPLGAPEKMAVEMIQEQVNAKGGVLGRPVEVIIKDDKSDPTEATMAAKDLIETQKVCAIIGPSGTPTTMPVIETCEKAKIPLISCAAGRPITDPIKPYVFAVPQTDALAVQRIVDYLNKQGIKQVATIYVSTAYGESGQKQLTTQLATAKIEILASEKFGPDDTDMTAQLTKIKEKKPAAVVCWGTNPGPAHVAKGMKKLGMTMPLIQSHGVANQKFLELAGEAAEGVQLPAGRLIVWQSVPDSHAQKAVLKEFAEAFKAKHNKDADTFAGHAYDSLNIVLKAIEAASSTEPSKIRDAVEKTTNFVGTAGVFNYTDKDHNGLTKEAFVWVEVSNGAWKLVE